MYNRGGIGLAAPQVGIPLRLFVMDTQWVDTDTYKPYVFINPVVVDESNEKHNILEEGCLSVLSIKVPIVRSNEIVLKYKDMQWKDREIVLHGMPAVCGGHEIEHLNGRLIIDHMPYWQKDLYRRRMKRAKKKVKKYLNERI